MAFAHNNEKSGIAFKVMDYIKEKYHLNDSDILEFTYEQEMVDFFISDEGVNTTQTGVSFMNETGGGFPSGLFIAYTIYYNSTGKQDVLAVQTIIDNAIAYLSQKASLPFNNTIIQGN